MSQIWNFSAGPSVLPQPVLERARDELLDWQGSGISVMEHSHRSRRFIAMVEQIEADLRTLLTIPSSYAVLFLQGGATQHFAQIPLNLALESERADYVINGFWGAKAASEAASYVGVNKVVENQIGPYQRLPPRVDWRLDPKAAYVHYTPNETVHGLEYRQVPDVGEVPLVADFSSAILSEPMDVSRFGLIYACTQKNIGPSGLVLLIVRRDLLERRTRPIASIFSYAAHAAAASILNTPNVWGWYLAGLCFQWLKAQGGLASMARHNAIKSERLYAAIDGSAGYYRNQVEPAARSRMNVPFTLHDNTLEADFLRESEEAGLIALKGHKALGGMRASLYNALPLEAVEALTSFMNDFARRHG